ncbi:hypothetical protein C8R45DRAFT_529129 [Mycena sanguinolenta]|nr:hypothetical protein C8R45DRAFT_529129 [Mycena sanguinolenta]
MPTALTIAQLLEPFPPTPSPDIIRLLRTNDVPVDAEVIIVREIILDAEIRLRAIREHSRAPVNAATLTATRSETEHNLREHRAILSAVRRIPAELVCEISDLSTAQSRVGARGTPPWKLGWICRSWRAYALGYPSLWSSVTVPACTPVFATLQAQLLGAVSQIWWDYCLLTEPAYRVFFPFPAYASPGRNRNIVSLLARLEAQFLRSAAVSLDIHWLRVTGYSPDSSLLDLVLPHSNRWRTVSSVSSMANPLRSNGLSLCAASWTNCYDWNLSASLTKLLSLTCS